MSLTEGERPITDTSRRSKIGEICERYLPWSESRRTVRRMEEEDVRMFRRTDQLRGAFQFRVSQLLEKALGRKPHFSKTPTGIDFPAQVEVIVSRISFLIQEGIEPAEGVYHVTDTVYGTVKRLVRKDDDMKGELMTKVMEVLEEIPEFEFISAEQMAQMQLAISEESSMQ